MPSKETLYRRPLKRPIDQIKREAITTEFSRRRREIPVPAELRWDAEGRRCTIDAKWLSFIVSFSREEMVVDAELSLAARMFATDSNRSEAVQFIRSLADELDL